MKLFKKVMSLIIASIMMLQVAAFAAPAPADVNGTYYENAAKLLSALEIMVGDGNSFNGDKNITRAEFTKIMVVAAGHANIVGGYKAKGVFSDVAVSEWYAPYIEFGKDMGAINGMGDGTFAPNDNVTGEQAVKMMVATIGYGLRAEENGGYPAGYVEVARDIGALKGLASVNLEEPMTRGQAAVLCANILEIDVMKKVSSGDVEKWEAKEGVTLLSEKFNTYKVEGLVSANGATALWEETTLKAGEVEITAKGEKIELLVGETDIDKQLGSTVKAYYTYDDDTEESNVICYSVSAKNTSNVTLDLSQLKLEDCTNTLITYWENEDDTKPKEIEVEAISAVLYNGAAAADNIETILRDTEGMPGSITLIDSDSTQGAETVMIKAYETYVIEYIDVEDYEIIDEIGEYKNGANGTTKKMQIDVENKNVTASIVDVNGRELSFDSLQEGDVLSIAASDSMKIFEVIASDTTAVGVVKEFGTDANGKTVVVLDNGEKYLFGDSFEAYVAARGGHGLKLDQGVALYLDAFGRIAKYEAASSGDADGEYGLILAYVPSQSTTGSIEMKLFTADGEFAILPLASKVTIDGAKYSTDATIMTALNNSVAGANRIYGNGGYSKDAEGNRADVSPMLYKLDDYGAIKYIDTPYNPDYEDAYTLGKIKSGSAGPKVMNYNSEYKGFDYTTALNPGAVIFAVPSDSALLENEKYVRIVKSSEFLTEEAYKLQLFNTDRDSRAYNYGVYATNAGSSEAFRTAETQSLQRQRPYFIVTKVAKTLLQDEYGEDIVTIKVYGNEEGSNKTLTIDPDYYNNGRYIKGDDSMSDHLFNGVTYNVAGTGERNANITSHAGVMGTERAANGVLPGDIFTYGTNAEGYVHYVRTIFLANEQIFVSKTAMSDEGRRYESSDLTIPVEKDGTTVLFDVISAYSPGVFAQSAFAFTVNGGLIDKNYDGDQLWKMDAGLNKKVYDKEVLDVNMTYAVSKVLVYDAAATSEAKRVTSGSVTDIIDVTNPLEAATPCIVRVFNSGIKVVVVLKNLPDTPVI